LVTLLPTPFGCIRRGLGGAGLFHSTALLRNPFGALSTGWGRAGLLPTLFLQRHIPETLKTGNDAETNECDQNDARGSILAYTSVYEFV